MAAPRPPVDCQSGALWTYDPVRELFREEFAASYKQRKGSKQTAETRNGQQSTSLKEHWLRYLNVAETGSCQCCHQIPDEAETQEGPQKTRNRTEVSVCTVTRTLSQSTRNISSNALKNRGSVLWSNETGLEQFLVVWSCWTSSGTGHLQHSEANKYQNILGKNAEAWTSLDCPKGSTKARFQKKSSTFKSCCHSHLTWTPQKISDGGWRMLCKPDENL